VLSTTTTTTTTTTTIIKQHPETTKLQIKHKDIKFTVSTHVT
jgi:hypothetical protein